MGEPGYAAVLVGDGVVLRLTDAFAASMLRTLDPLLQLLEDGVVPTWLRGRAPSAEAVLRQMFPVADAFWERHRAALTDPRPARRVRGWFAEPWTLRREEIDDWLITSAQLRTLYLMSPVATTAGAQAFGSLPSALVAALDPQADTGWPL